MQWHNTSSDANVVRHWISTLSVGIVLSVLYLLFHLIVVVLFLRRAILLISGHAELLFACVAVLIRYVVFAQNALFLK